MSALNYSIQRNRFARVIDYKYRIYRSVIYYINNGKQKPLIITGCITSEIKKRTEYSRTLGPIDNMTVSDVDDGKKPPRFQV